VISAALFAGVIAYALLGGADFGSGLYDLTAGNGPDGAKLHMLIDESIGPVWEANHVWLIYVIVMWWTGFPASFAAATTTLFIPLTLALAGIVLRGASFAFRENAPSVRQVRLFGGIFAATSLITPFFLGAVAGALASGRVPARGYGSLMTSWVNPTSLTGGALAVAACSFLAGVYLTADASRAQLTDLADRLRRRTLLVGIILVLIAFGGLYAILHDAPTLSRGMSGHALPVLLAAALAAVLTLAFVYERMYATARISAAVAVGAAVAAWGVGQYPWMLVDELTIQAAAGARATLQAQLVVVSLAVVVVVPALAYLLWFIQRAKTYLTQENSASTSQ
jgi:cytochrome bd ubiquinol oxidase subunit II